MISLIPFRDDPPSVRETILIWREGNPHGWSYIDVQKMVMFGRYPNVPCNWPGPKTNELARMPYGKRS